MMRRVLAIGILGSLLAASAGLSGARADAASAGPEPIRYEVPLSPAAQAKLDPHLAMTMASQAKARSAADLALMARRIVILGEDLESLRFPVIIRSHLDDAELAALGAAPNSRAGRLTTAIVEARDLERLAGHPGVEAIEASYWLEPVMDLSIPEIRADEVNHGGAGSYTGQGVLYGLMDTGIDHTHADFKDAQNNTRIVAIWDQYASGNSPAGFDYGYEYTRTMIDNGQANSHRDTGGHGTHVAGTSVGDGSSLNPPKYRGVAWEAEIVAVANGGCDMFCYGGGVPPHGDATTVGALDGLNYMLQKAQALGKPLVVNQSQGVTMGPHDGTTLYEQAYDEFIDNQGLIICIAAGNDQDADWHGRRTVTPGGQGSFTVYQDPAEPQAFIAFECWYDDADEFRWEILSPGGTTVSVDANMTGSYLGWITSHADTVWYWSSTNHPANAQGYLYVAMQNRTAGVETSNWTVRAIAQNSLPGGGQVDLYCERNQPYTKVTGGLSTVSIVGMPGTTTGAITVAAYNTKIEWDALDGQHHSLAEFGLSEVVGDIAYFSSHGPRRDGVLKPEIGAPGQMIASTWADGYEASQIVTDPQGQHVLLQGTSMACPHVAGVVALMLEKDPTLTPAEVKSILQETARTDAFTNTYGASPNTVFGHGKLDAKAAVDAVGGGPSGCATRSGDATQDNAVDVRDIVATVNDILALIPLSEGGRNCADLASPAGTINIQDVVGIVNLILGAKRLVGDEAAPGPVVWREAFAPSSYRLVLGGSDVAGLQMSFIPARGYVLAGDPVFSGASEGVEVRWSERLGQYHLVAYSLSGTLAEPGREVALEIPLVRAWDGREPPERSAVTHLVLCDRWGRALELARDDGPRDPEAPGGLRAYLSRTWPNPSSAATRIAYHLPASGEVRMEVYDTAGRRIRSLWDGWQMAGDHTLAWDNRDERGHRVAAGAYFVRLKSAAGEQSLKITVVE